MPSHTAKSYTVNTGSIKRVNKREKMQSKNSRSPITGSISLSVAVRWDDWGVNTKLISKNWLVPTPTITFPASLHRGTAVSPRHRCSTHTGSRLLPTASTPETPRWILNAAEKSSAMRFKLGKFGTGRKPKRWSACKRILKQNYEDDNRFWKRSRQGKKSVETLTFETQRKWSRKIGTENAH